MLWEAKGCHHPVLLLVGMAICTLKQRCWGRCCTGAQDGIHLIVEWARCGTIPTEPVCILDLMPRHNQYMRDECIMAHKIHSPTIASFLAIPFYSAVGGS